MRGLKRKFGGGASNETDDDKQDYKQNLSQFQTLARQRESMRLKNHCLQLPNSTPGFWEKHLSEKLHVENQMIKGTARFLAACKNEEQSLEAGKRLHLSKTRRDMLKYELNKLKRVGGRASPLNSTIINSNGGSSSSQSRPSYAGISISDVRIPLMWKRKDHLKDVGDNRRFAVFCLARIGSQIYDSALISPIDRTQTDINLNDVFLFNKVSSHFEITIEVYSKLLNGNNSTSSLVKEAEDFLGKTPQKIVRSISKAVGKKLLMSNNVMSNNEDLNPKQEKQLSEEVFNVGPKFEMIASVTLNIDNCSHDVETHELYVEDRKSQNCPPMFGAICCRLAALPYCCEDPVLQGQIQIKYDSKASKSSANTVVDFTSAKGVFASLMEWKLSIWLSKDQKESARRPVLVIPINRDSCILEKNDLQLTITTRCHETYVSSTWKLIFETEEKENQQKWSTALMQHAADHRRWKIAATKRLALGSLAEVDLYSSTNDSEQPSRSHKKPRYTKSFKRTRMSK